MEFDYQNIGEDQPSGGFYWRAAETFISASIKNLPREILSPANSHDFLKFRTTQICTACSTTKPGLSWQLKICQMHKYRVPIPLLHSPFRNYKENIKGAGRDKFLCYINSWKVCFPSRSSAKSTSNLQIKGADLSHLNATTKLRKKTRTSRKLVGSKYNSRAAVEQTAATTKSKKDLVVPNFYN